MRTEPKLGGEEWRVVRSLGAVFTTLSWLALSTDSVWSTITLSTLICVNLRISEKKKSDTEELIFFFLFCHGQRKFENIYKIFHKRKKTLRRRKKNVELPDLEEGTCAVCSNGKCRKKKTSAQKQTLCDRLCWRSSCSALFIRPLCLGNNDTDAAHTGTERGKKKVIIRLHMENRGKIKKIGNMGRNKTIVTGRRTMSTTE